MEMSKSPAQPKEVPQVRDGAASLERLAVDEVERLWFFGGERSLDDPTRAKANMRRLPKANPDSFT
jgi:hypothetical protein